jgi:hypothetical protein
MSKKSFDKRIAFITAALNAKLVTNANIANEWYINNKAAKLDNDEALRRFKEWLS